MHQDYMYQDDEWLPSERGRYVFLKVSYGDPYVFLYEDDINYFVITAR